MSGYFALPSAEPKAIDVEELVSEHYLQMALGGEPVGELVLESEL